MGWKERMEQQYGRPSADELEAHVQRMQRADKAAVTEQAGNPALAERLGLSVEQELASRIELGRVQAELKAINERIAARLTAITDERKGGVV